MTPAHTQGENSCEEDDDEDDDGFFVPHGYLSDGEGGDDMPAVGLNPTGGALVCVSVYSERQNTNCVILYYKLVYFRTMRSSVTKWRPKLRRGRWSLRVSANP